MEREKQLIIVRGGGDIATGTIHKLWTCGYPVLVLETKYPSAIRRHVAFSEAVYDKETVVEGVVCALAAHFEEALAVMKSGRIPMLIDPEVKVLKSIRPFALVDAILAKKNLGTCRSMADRTIALGPGFTAGEDVDLVIETMRGHHLGRILTEGSAIPNTGIPGSILGYGRERVIHAPVAGRFESPLKIGDMVEKGQKIGHICGENGCCTQVFASLTGLLRGLIRNGYPVTSGFKIADIDPREEEFENCFTISDKARCIAGGVLEGILQLENRKGDGYR